jgi:ribosomal-protein-alanine N-acetyltransferase
MRSVFLKSRDIFLGALSRKEKLDGYANWINDQETTLFMGSGRFPLDNEELKDYIKMYTNSKDGMILGIFLKRSSRHIGNITLHQIDWRNRNAEVGVIIGDRRVRGMGYATESIRLVAEHAFNKLNLWKLYSGMIKGNEASKKAFEKVGFKVEGILKEHFYLNGKYLDCFRMGLLKTEFTDAKVTIQ